MMSPNKRQKSEEDELAFVYREGDNVPDNVTKVIVDASVTEIPDGDGISSYNCQGVFSHCKQLMEVVLNEGLQKIGTRAFDGCSSLTIITFPSTVTEIGAGAFYGCTNLKEVVFNDGLQKIGCNSFWGCTSLSIINLPSTVTDIGGSAFAKCVQLKEVVLNTGLQEIGACTFYNCESLRNIKLPSTVTEIGSNAFYECKQIREVVLNEGLQKIGGSAFSGCSSLSIIRFPSTVTEVGALAFYGCTYLREVVLHEGLQEIRRNTFGHCSSLEYVKFPTISNRVKMLIGAGESEIKDRITIYQHFEWRGDEFLVSPAAIYYGHWDTTMRELDQLLASISYYELKEATTIIELAMWKTKIGETGAVTAEERSACRVAACEVPGPAKDAIVQYLQVDIGVDGDVNESDDSSQHSDSSGDDY